MVDNPVLSAPSGRRRCALSTVAMTLLGIALITAVWVILVPSVPDFITHVGVVAGAPDDQTTLRLYYRYPRLKLADVTAVNLVLSDGEVLPARDLRSDQTSPPSRGNSPAMSLAPLRHLDVSFAPQRPGSCTIVAIVVRVAGDELTCPIGEISLVVYGNGEVDKRQTSTVSQFSGAAQPNAFRVHTQLPDGLVVRCLEPELKEAEVRLSETGAADNGGYDDYEWTFTIPPRYWGAPTCVVYRPVVVADRGGTVTRTFGPDLAFIADLPAGVRP